jgi:adenine nucleotide transporter 17
VKIGINEGQYGLWGGTVASLVLVSNPAIKFTAYEYLKRLLVGKSAASQLLSPSKAFMMGALASVIATLITYPVQVVQTKSRVIFSSIKVFHQALMIIDQLYF